MDDMQNSAAQPTHWCIKGARLIDPANKIDTVGNLYVQDGKVAEITLDGSPVKSGVESIDAEGLWLIPGLIDGRARVAAGQAELGDLALSETAAACAGGFTTVVVPPTTEAPLNEPNAIRHLIKAARRLRKLRVLSVSSAVDSSGKGLSEIGSLAAEGSIGIGNHHFIQDTNLIANAIAYGHGFKLLTYVSPRDGYLGVGVAHTSRVSMRLGLEGIPPEAETIEVFRWLALANSRGAPIHFSGISCGGSLKLITEAISEGQVVSADVPLHNLLYTDDVLEKYEAKYHLMPPLRSESDRQALLKGVRGGQLSICSNHRPLPATSKELSFAESEPGTIALETTLPLIYQQLIEPGHLTASEAISALTSVPAKSFRLATGSLKVGTDADLCLFDPLGTTHTDRLQTSGDNLIEEGELKGAVIRTWHQGEPTFIRSDPENPQ